MIMPIEVITSFLSILHFRKFNRYLSLISNVPFIPLSVLLSFAFFDNNILVYFGPEKMWLNLHILNSFTLIEDVLQKIRFIFRSGATLYLGRMCYYFLYVCLSGQPLLFAGRYQCYC